MRSKRIVLFGAGSAQFGLGTVSDIIKSKVLNKGTIVLHDINDIKLELIRKAAHMAIEKMGVDFSLKATTSRSEAL